MKNQNQWYKRINKIMSCEPAKSIRQIPYNLQNNLEKKESARVDAIIYELQRRIDNKTFLDEI
jgi:hypothetical protein